MPTYPPTPMTLAGALAWTGRTGAGLATYVSDDPLRHSWQYAFDAWQRATLGLRGAAIAGGSWGGSDGYHAVPLTCDATLAVGDLVHCDTVDLKLKKSLATTLANAKVFAIVIAKPTTTTCHIGHIYLSDNVNNGGAGVRENPVYLQNDGSFGPNPGTVAVRVGTYIATDTGLIEALPLPADFFATLAPQALTDAATIAWDMSLGTNAKVTLGGNRTLGTPSNIRAGSFGWLTITQDGTGSRTLAYNGVWIWANGKAVLQTAAGAIDVLFWYSPDGTNLYATLNTDPDAHAVQTLTDAANIVYDMVLGRNARVTLAGNRTLNAPGNLRPGMNGRLTITQDGTGNRTLAFNAVWKFINGTPVLQTPAGAIDVLEWYSPDGTNLYAWMLGDPGTRAVQTLTDAATIAWDQNLGVNAKVTLGGNRTLGAPTNIRAGASGRLTITQDATGSRTLAYNAVWQFFGGVVPVLQTAAGAIDVLEWYSPDGTNLYARLLSVPTHTLQSGNGALSGVGTLIVTTVRSPSNMIACYKDAAGAGILYTHQGSTNGWSIVSASGATDNGKTVYWIAF